MLATVVIVATLGTLAAIPWLRLRLGARGWVDRPRADRHAVRPVPRVGGLGWIAGCLAGAALAALLGALGRTGLLAILVVALGGAMGVLDDRGRLSPLPKALLGFSLLLLLLAALRLGAPGAPLDAGTAGFLATLLPAEGGGLRFALVLGLASILHLALQIFDNLDGVVGATALVGFLHLAGSVTGLDALSLALIGAGATAGFLVWNAPPASVFLGNSGSQAAGLLLAALLGHALLSAPDGRTSLGVILPFAWPLADLAFVVVRRARGRRAPWVGGRDHTTHLLAARWGGDRRVFLAVATSALLLALLARFLLGTGRAEV